MKRFPAVLFFTFLFNHFCFCQVWHSLERGVGSDVNSMKVHNNILYVGGCFEWANGLDSIGWPDGILATGIATWNGTEWDSVRNIHGNNGLPGFGPCVRSIEFFNDEIYIGGDFVDISVTPTRLRLAKIDSTNNWCDVGSIGYPNSVVKSFYVKDILYIGGEFNYIGSISNINAIAGWDGTNYSKLGNGLQYGGVYDFEEYNGMLVTGGSFWQAGDTSAFSIAAWDGQKWYPLDTGLLGNVYSLTVDTINNFLYAGGGISYAGGNSDMIRVHRVARWDGYQWSALGTDSTGLFYNDVFALCMYHDKLFAAGISTNWSPTDTIIACWNGKNWRRIDGPQTDITVLCTYNDELYVGGAFHIMADSTMYNIARYYEPPDTTCDYLQAIIQPKNTVLNISDSTTVHFYNNIIHGSSWHWDFGDGETDTVRMPVHTYAGAGVYNVTVIVTFQNCTDTAYTTITIVDDVGIKDNKNDSLEYLGNNIPNPFDNSTTIPYYIPNGSKGTMQITNTKGELVDEYSLLQGKNELNVSIQKLTPGTYFYSIIINGEKKETRKMIFGK
jgi:hypothetical protein